ncbi:hypothetical protein [Natrononativus amylolyticus]|uniref:hypothetical protein n=1 Tax=Natrononativus amylolyticus TaxID=2963434 RepID=UPI0020CF92AC|nr:hypothetical protein [Natrononativus amylolyticus]
MSEELHDRIESVLEDAESRLESLPDDDDAEWSELLEDEDNPLREAADEAAALIDDTDSESLLEALSLTSLPDGSEPESIPQAIAEGDSEKVETLQALTRLSKLSDSWDGDDESALEDRFEDVRETLAAPTDEGEGADESSTDESADAEDDGLDVGESIQSAMSDAFDGFGDEFREAKTQLEGLVGDDEEASGETEDEETDDEDEGDDGEDGLLGGTESSGSTRHSTVAPSPSKRADMKGVKRHSTMPDRDSRSGMGN